MFFTRMFILTTHLSPALLSYSGTAGKNNYYMKCCIFYQPKSGGDARIAGPEYFRLEQLQEEFNFVTDEELNLDRRLTLLELREKEVPEFRNMKMIPAHSHEIHPDVFKVWDGKLLFIS